jgi:hypothetical protein
MRRPLASIAVLVLLVVATACGGTRRADGDAPRRDPNTITREELMARPFSSAYEAVESLHSNWLQSRGTDSFNSPSQIWVYLDGTRLGGVESLRTLAPSAITSIRRIDALEATSRWGINHGQGVILVSMSPR